ncbi:hypothetical protein GCM10011497_29600 [Elstera cyanobacteriorum]|uniref:hypothetical protein n=1 Tax=Elstera cyanobacteriorum TaxID=2022747 RepID=UPI0011403158|nr:hypothetical protein [Elstera cyanobacteriorum]GFZ97178.1 hypothetical protein GCM10011497_29600 [Elstera cyanobacteriorum]
MSSDFISTHSMGVFGINANLLFPILVFGGAGWWGLYQTIKRARAGEPMVSLFDTALMLIGMTVYAPYLYAGGNTLFLLKLDGPSAILAYAVNSAPLLMGGFLLMKRYLCRRRSQANSSGASARS